MGGLSGFPARFELFWRCFWKKPLKPLNSCLKNRSKTAHFLRWFLNGFSSKIWAIFKRFLSGLIKKPIKTNKKAWKGNVTLLCSWNTTWVDLHMLILHFPTPKMLILQFPTSAILLTTIFTYWQFMLLISVQLQNSKKKQLSNCWFSDRCCSQVNCWWIVIYCFSFWHNTLFSE